MLFLLLSFCCIRFSFIINQIQYYILDGSDEYGPFNGNTTVGGFQPQILFMDDGQPRFVCPQCGVKYKKLSGVKGHLKECGKGAQCPFCPKIVTQRRNLPKHMEKHKRDGLWEFSTEEIKINSIYRDNKSFIRMMK